MIEITDEMVTIARRHSIVLTSAVAKDLLAAVAPLIAAQEREACAKVCSPDEPFDSEMRSYGDYFAAAIRTRGETK